MKMTSLFVACLLISAAARAQGPSEAVLNQRAAKILSVLEISDSVRVNQLQKLLVNQYQSINVIYAQREAEVTRLRNEAAGKGAVVILEQRTDSLLQQQHASFLSGLASLANAQQIEAIKDGMTYGVLPVTVKAYQDMIPSLTAEEKSQIRTWLVEAREKAMDAGSSEAKHGVFGKYKGRINNYLSARGYDLQKERRDWEARLKKN